MTYALLLERFVFDGEARQEFIEALAWPEVIEDASAKVQDQSARDAAATLGFNPEAMLAAALAARAQTEGG